MVPGSVNTAAVELRRVGPGGSMAPDNAFAVALLTLWHRVAEAGGAVGFDRGIDRAAVGGAVSPVVDALKSGRGVALALAQGRLVVGFALLDRGTLTSSHTGVLSLLLVEPASRRLGHGTSLMGAILELARSTGIERVRLGLPAGAGIEHFFSRFGFRECGRLPGWIRLGAADQDELVMVAELGSADRPGRCLSQGSA